MSTDPSTPTPQPAELCGYAVVETLTPGACYLAIGPGGRGVALKKLDPDCMLGSLLHPDVRDRLSRVRELAHAGVANLIGVGKAGDDAWLIWEYVEGKPLAEHAREHCRSPRDLAVLVRELVLTVESLHMQGIVHGSISSGNVIVAPDGSIRLTHISPLLYTDPSDDAEAIEEMVTAIVEQRGEQTSVLARLMADAREAKMPLRALAGRLAVLTDARETSSAPPGSADRAEGGMRKRALFGALVVALAGVAVAYGVWRAAGEPGAERVPSWLIGR
jgi:hypothetical protein